MQGSTFFVSRTVFSPRDCTEQARSTQYSQDAHLQTQQFQEADYFLLKLIHAVHDIKLSK